eukprot:12900023-Prorocentrum_lima.AAC.1
MECIMLLEECVQARKVLEGTADAFWKLATWARHMLCAFPRQLEGLGKNHPAQIVGCHAVHDEEVSRTH